MLKKLLYILLMTLLQVARLAAQESYVIDKVCTGAARTYRIDGEQNSTYTWALLDPSGNTVTLTNAAGTPFTDKDKDGNTIYGSELGFTWNVSPGIYKLSAEQKSDKKCVTLELGTIEVVPNPTIFAGNDQKVCAGSIITLSQATAQNYGSLAWNTSGDGFFTDNTRLNAVYTPGINDLASGTVTLTLIAAGQGLSGSCENVTDDLKVTFEKLAVTIHLA